jgi:hypothetical protein
MGIFPLRDEDELPSKAHELNVIKNNVKIAKMIRWMDFTEKSLVKHFVLLIVRPPISTGFCNEIMCVNII